jgi:hypothetical protein
VVLRGGEEVAPAGQQSYQRWAERFEPVLAELREGLRERRPEKLAAVSGVSWQAEAAEFHLRCLDQEFRISWPELVAYPVGAAEPCPANLQGLFLYYLSLSDGTPLTGHWIAFRELPDGWLYHQAFQGYTGDALVRTLGNDLEAFARAAERIGGQREAMGDAGYAFDALPRVRLAVVYWQGDDEFPPHAQVLFDAAASHYLPTDGLAILGHRLIHRLQASVKRDT